jgi:cytochrome c2
VLTSRFGGLGNSAIGPNLSGLLTEYYPPTYKEKERWTVDALGKWLKNPREIRKLTQMPPQKLSVKKFKRLLKEVWDFAENI